tara:strand:+ start:210 stop:389 length:180 start_codon:yes stop_codon:yes gene_type:complete
MGLKLSKKRVQGGKELDIGAKKRKKVSKRGGGDFNIEMKIPKELVDQGVMYGYKKGGQI